MTGIEATSDPAPEGQDGLPEPRAIDTLAAAEELILHLMDVMDALLAVVEQETELVRAGRGDTAARLQQSKSDLARHYIAGITQLRASQTYLRHAVPDSLAALHRRHDMFRALLQINLTVLAVAEAVADGQAAHASAARPRNAGEYGTSARRRSLADPRGAPAPVVRPASRPSLPDGALLSRRNLP
jgi:hypothetical protein